ncbi:unnamed protein product, partial [Iphiclides podalirius]
MSESDRLLNNGTTSRENSDARAEGDAFDAVSDREAYFQALRLWIQQAQMYQNISTCFPYYMMTFQGLQNNPTNIPLLNNNYQFQGHQFPFQIPNPRPAAENQNPAERLTPAEAVDMFELIDVEKFDFYKFSEHYDDYKYAMELTSEILFLEVIYRILVCIFEAFCLCGSVGRTGGATPGKALLGLRVVTATAVIPVEVCRNVAALRSCEPQEWPRLSLCM